MSEITVAQALQTALRGMGEFADADVTINDWSILDGPGVNAPYCIIETADTFDARWRTVSHETTWNIPITLIVYFQDWDVSLNEFRTIRQAVIDMLDTSADGTLGLTVRRIRSDGNIGEIYPAYLTPELRAEATPIFISQRLIIETEEY